jgi:quinol monooxygenase YgiN
LISIVKRKGLTSFANPGNDALNYLIKEIRMIYEILTQHVEPEKRDEYIKVFGDILKKANYAGSHAINFFTSIEEPSRVILMIAWDSVEAHTQHRGTPTHNAMREATARYQTQKGDGGHFVLHQVKS